MSKLISVAEGILDSSGLEYLDFNLESIDRVKDYALNGMDLVLNTSEAAAIYVACHRWLDGVKNQTLNGTNDFYYTVTYPLEVAESKYSD